jgi:hypothetical protein
VQELAEEEKQGVAGLVEDQVDAVEEAERGRGAKEVEPPGEDLPAENRQGQEAQGPARDRGESGGVRA